MEGNAAMWALLGQQLRQRPRATQFAIRLLVVIAVSECLAGGVWVVRTHWLLAGVSFISTVVFAWFVGRLRRLVAAP